MAEAQRESFFERTLGNLAGAWRDIASGTALRLGLAQNGRAARDASSLERLMTECLEARGGEVSARMRAAGLGKTYLELDDAGRQLFLEVLAQRFAADEDAIDAGLEAYRQAGDEAARQGAHEALRRALQPPRVRLLTQFNVLPEGVKFLADLRSDLLMLADEDPYLRGLERDLRDLLESWFDVGFLDLRRITWDSPASLLEKLIAYEAVHAISSWADLRNRLDSDRRLYALFHPRMPDEPLAFVEVALVRGMAGSVQALLDETAPRIDPDQVDTAIFYSISNTQKGLTGISFGDYLIKRVVQRLAADLPGLKRFATLSPMPGFSKWLKEAPAKLISDLLTEPERNTIRKLGGDDGPRAALLALLGKSEWHGDAGTAETLKEPLLRLSAQYLAETRDDGRPIDPVARFHLKNGARLERINWLADTSEKGLKQSSGMMVNYRYTLDDIEANHEAYMERGRVAMSVEVKSLARSAARRAKADR